MGDQDQNIHNFINHQRTPNQQMEDRELSFDSLLPAINNMTKGLATMQKRFKKLERVNNALTQFNESFGSFLYGMALNDSTVQWPGAPTAESYQAFRERLKTTAIAKEPSGPVEEVVVEAQPKPRPAKRKAEVQTQPIQAKRRFVVKVDIPKIFNGLPLDYRDQTQRMKDMKKILVYLKTHPDGLPMKELAKEVQLAHHIVTACINVLLRSKDAVKKSVPGSYAVYLLDPGKYPSVPK